VRHLAISPRAGAAAALVAAFLAGCQKTPPRDLVFVSLDTVRADHLQPYGYPRETSPRLAELARDSWLFTRAFAQDTNTLPSHASVLTGRYPPQHGALENGMPLVAAQGTLTQLLRDRGWATGAFVGGWPLRAEISGLDRGFEVYDDELVSSRRPCHHVVSRGRAWWQRNAGRRRFLFLHFYDAHGPYDPPVETAAQLRSGHRGPPVARLPGYQRTADNHSDEGPTVGVQELVDAYDASLRALDRCVEDALSDIDLASALVVVFSDHGETLAERYWQFDHGGAVYDEQARVLLMFHGPGTQPRRVDSLVELVDVAPTTLSLLDLEVPADFAVAGQDLTAVVARRASRRALAFSSARPISDFYADKAYALARDKWRIQGLRTERWKLVLLPGIESDYTEFYDLAADPGETQSIPPPARPPEAAALERSLRRYAALQFQALRPTGLSEADAAMLRSLGYLD